MSSKFQFIGLIKVQNRATGQVLTIPPPLSVISPYPVFCGAVVPSVPAARYCKRSFGFARFSRFRSLRSVRMPRFSIGAQARYPSAPPPFRLPSAPFPCAGWAVVVVMGVFIMRSPFQRKCSRQNWWECCSTWHLLFFMSVIYYINNR